MEEESRKQMIRYTQATRDSGGSSNTQRPLFRSIILIEEEEEDEE